MKYCRMFMYDLRNSLMCNRSAYLLVALMMVLICMNYGSAVRRYNEQEQFETPEYQEYMLNLVRGMEKLPEDSMQRRQPEIPLAYMGIAICISYITGRYIFSDSAYTVLVQGQSRTAWIVSKSLTTGVEIVLVYGLALAVSLLFGGIGNGVELSRCEKWMKLDNVQTEAFSQPLFLILTLIVPSVTAYAIAQLQIAVSLLFNDIAGFITAIIIYFGSVFEYNLFMLGNGCMVQRSRYFMAEGLSVVNILLLDAAVIIGAIAVQVVTAQKKDW